MVANGPISPLDVGIRARDPGSSGSYIVTVTKSADMRSKRNGKSATLPNMKKSASGTSSSSDADKSATLTGKNGASSNGDNAAPMVMSSKQCWKMMCSGTLMTKVSMHDGKKNVKKRLVLLDEDLLHLRYKPTRKKHGFSIGLQELKTVLSDSRLPDDGSLTSYPSDCCFVIVYLHEGEAEQLHLVAPSKEVKKKWCFGVRSLIQRRGYLLSRPDPLRDEWLKEAFEKHDEDSNGALSVVEVDKLLRNLNIFLDEATLKRFFDQANVDGPQGHKDGMLTKEEFAVFFKNISTRQEIVDILRKYAKSEQSLSVAELENFLKNNNCEKKAVRSACEEVIEKFEPVSKLRQQLLLGLDGFTKFMLGPDGDVFDTDHAVVYHDMSQPLSHYFIASSHNTYLMEDQLRGPSSVDAYISALQRGCRCVELDCWDGSNNEPVIYHGHTLTSKILFKDVITAIAEHAFTASPYPVILSIENHCSVPQQDVMANYMKEIFGDMLCCDDIDSDRAELPSPEELKGKILVKGKKLPPSSDAVAPDGHNEMSEEEEDEGAYRQMNAEGAEVVKKDEEETEAVKGGETTLKKKKDKKLKLAQELSDLVNYIQSVHFVSFEKSHAGQHCCQMSSFGESKFCNLAESKPQDFIGFNKKFLTRTYPAGKRVDSSNYNPTIAWNAGCQIVALNYQTNGPMMDLQCGKFLDNGSCGYVLKPKCLLEGTPCFNPRAKEQSCKPMTLKLKIYSAQQLPKPKSSKEKAVIDPYVRVDLYGVPADTRPKAFTTTSIPNNGFNPVWDEGCTLTVQVPAVALLRFAVYDMDVGKDDFVAQFTLPVTSMKSGYRHVFLRDGIGKPIPHASLFIHVDLS